MLPIIRDFPRNKDGGFWHKEGGPEQMWLDGLYMAGTDLCGICRRFRQPEYLELAAKRQLLMAGKNKG